MQLDLDSNWPLYRCTECGALRNHIHVIKALKTGELCPCGANELSPTHPTLTDWFKPTLWRMVWAFLTGEFTWQRKF